MLAPFTINTIQQGGQLENVSIVLKDTVNWVKEPPIVDIFSNFGSTKDLPVSCSVDDLTLLELLSDSEPEQSPAVIVDAPKKRGRKKGIVKKKERKINPEKQGKGNTFGSCVQFEVMLDRKFHIKVFQNGSISVSDSHQLDGSDIRPAIEIIAAYLTKQLGKPVRLIELHPDMPNWKSCFLDGKLPNIHKLVCKIGEIRRRAVPASSETINEFLLDSRNFIIPEPEKEQEPMTITEFITPRIRRSIAECRKVLKDVHICLSEICSIIARYPIIEAHKIMNKIRDDAELQHGIILPPALISDLRHVLFSSIVNDIVGELRQSIHNYIRDVQMPKGLDAQITFVNFGKKAKEKKVKSKKHPTTNFNIPFIIMKIFQSGKINIINAMKDDVERMHAFITRFIEDNQLIYVDGVDAPDPCETFSFSDESQSE